MARLAIDGGRKTVTLTGQRWPRLGDVEIAALHKAIEKARTRDDYLCSAGGGEPVERFERKFAKLLGAKYAMTTNSGGAALHIAVMAAGVEAGDEVIVSPYSWGQTVSCILQQNAVPVFADIDPDTYDIDPATIESRITSRTKAIMVVHIFGQPADMRPIMRIARKHGLKVIEDCAQATGALHRGRRVGTFGDFGCFSIGDGKQISGGEGGVVLTKTRATHELGHSVGQHPARQLRVIKDKKLLRYADSLIYTYRIHPFAAVIVDAQLPYLDRWNGERRRNYDRLSRGLEDIPGIRPVHVPSTNVHVYHVYSPSFVPKEVPGVSRDVYVRALAAEGVPIGLGYVRVPIHLRPRMQEFEFFYGKGCPWKCHAASRKVRYRKGDCPVAEKRCAKHELTLGGGPSWLGDQSKLVDQVLDAFGKVTGNLDVLRKLTRRDRKKP